MATREASERERALAWRVLAYEAGGDQIPRGLADALTRAFDKLYDALEDLIGTGGFDALCARALHLAKARFPYLGGVTIEVQPDAFRFQGLQASIEGRSELEVRDGLTAVLASFFWLLVTFIGDTLFLNLFHRIWHEDTLGGSGLGSEGTKE